MKGKSRGKRKKFMIIKKDNQEGKEEKRKRGKEKKNNGGEKVKNIIWRKQKRK